MTTKQTILMAGGILAAALLIGGIFFFMGLRSQKPETASPTPTPMTTITETPAPIMTQKPSPTPTKSATPTPTKKPSPTPTITSTPSPTMPPGVVNIEANVSPTTSSTCSQKFTFTAKIYTNGAATVKYKWLRSDNASASEQTLTYAEAGMQTVTTDWTLGQASGSTYNGWQRIEITSPASALGNKAEFTLSCP